MEGKKVGELVLEGRCPEAMELAEKAREASEHLQAAAEILEGIAEVELAYEVIACGSPSRSGGQRIDSGRRPRGGAVRRALLASAAVMDAAGWMCTAQGAYGLARVCFSAALPFIAAWVAGSLWAR